MLCAKGKQTPAAMTGSVRTVGDLEAIRELRDRPLDCPVIPNGAKNDSFFG